MAKPTEQFTSEEMEAYFRVRDAKFTKNMDRAQLGVSLLAFLSGLTTLVGIAGIHPGPSVIHPGVPQDPGLFTAGVVGFYTSGLTLSSLFIAEGIYKSLRTQRLRRQQPLQVK